MKHRNGNKLNKGRKMKQRKEKSGGTLLKHGEKKVEEKMKQRKYGKWNVKRKIYETNGGKIKQKWDKSRVR